MTDGGIAARGCSNRAAAGSVRGRYPRTGDKHQEIQKAKRQADPTEKQESLTPRDLAGVPGRAPLHILLEFDRATEPTERLHGKATWNARELPRSVLIQRRVQRAVGSPEAFNASSGFG